MSKKLIAGAGVVASFAIALAPLATFAADSARYDQMGQKDTLKVTIEEVCALGHNFTASSATDRETGTHTDGATAGEARTTINGEAVASGVVAGTTAGKWDHTHASGGDTLGDSPAETDILYGVLENGTYTGDFGSTTLNIVCTGTDGYQLKAVGTALNPTGQGTAIPHQAIADGSYAASAWAFKIENGKASGNNKGTIANGYGTNYAAVATEAVIASAAVANTNNATNVDGGYDSWKITYGVAIDAEQEADTYTGTMTYTLVNLPSSGA